MGGVDSTYGERGGAIRVLARKREGKKRLGKPWHRWEKNIEMDLQDVG